MNNFKINSINNILCDIPIKNNMANASLLCSTNQKKFYSYKKLKSTHDELQNISTKLLIPLENLIYKESQAYWIHLEMIEHLAKWISISIGKQVSEQLRNFNEGVKTVSKKEENNLVDFPLKLKDSTKIVIQFRKDGYVNATQLCKAAGKKFNDWYRLKSTKELIIQIENQLNTETRISVLVVDIKKGGNDKKSQGSWIHPDLVVQHAQWLSPSLGKQVSEQLKKFNEGVNVKTVSKEKENNLVDFTLKLKDNTEIVIQFRKDGYVNATQLCKAAGKLFGHWYSLESTKELIRALEIDIGIPISELIDIKKGGDPKLQGSWIHPDLVVQHSQWLSTSLGKQVSEQLKKFNEGVNKNINVEIISKKEDTNTCNNLVDFTLKLKDNTEIVIQFRKDGYVNETQLCKAAGKHFKHWNSLDSTKELIRTLSSVVGIPTTELLDIKKGGDPKSQGSWIHPDLAVQHAQWLSTSFAIQVSRQIRQLYLTGKVELGKEKTNKELENIYEEQISKMKLSMSSLVNENSLLKNNYLSLEKTHDNILKKRNYHKFKKGNCLYIVKDDWREKEYLKFGIASNINDRLQDYRTIVPECKILFLVYLNNNKLLEDCIKSKYQNILTHINHEYILTIDTEELFKVINKLIKFLNIESTVDNTLDLYNKPYENNDILCIIENKVENNINLNEDLNEDCTSVIASVIEIKEYKCDLCDKVFKLKGNLSNHITTIHNKEEIDNTNTCHICKKVLSNRGKLYRHIQTVHEKSTKEECNICKKEYNSKDALNSHIKQIHEKSMIVKCSICDKIFTSNGNLTLHIKNVHEKSTKEECNICKKIFNTKSNLVTHIKQVHEKHNIISCKICFKELTSKSGYEYHMSKSHKILL